MIFNLRNWGLGGSISFNEGEPIFFRLWIGPVRIGWKYGYPD